MARELTEEEWEKAGEAYFRQIVGRTSLRWNDLPPSARRDWMIDVKHLDAAFRCCGLCIQPMKGQDDDTR